VSKTSIQHRNDLEARRTSPLATPADLNDEATRDIAAGLNGILSDVFALYLKTKNFHWHMSGPHFRDYHLLLDDQSDQLFAMTDPIAERVRKIGRRTLRSTGEIAHSECSTTMRNTSSPSTCLRNYGTTTRHSLLVCVRCTVSVTRAVMSRRPA
jgi:DNA-binding ferritin-like protein